MTVSQSLKKREGTKIEKIIKNKIIENSPYPFKITISQKGPDLLLKNEKKYKIEVKSIREYIDEKNNIRKGRFIIKKDDCFQSDIFIFVIKPVDQKLKWDKNKPLKIKIVKSQEVLSYFKNNKRNMNAKAIKLSIKEMNKFKEVNYSYLY